MDRPAGLSVAASTMEAAATTNTEEVAIQVELKLRLYEANLNSLLAGYNNDYKPSFNGRGGFQKRNDFRNDRNGDQQSGGGFYRAKPDYQQNDDFGGNRGGYRSVSCRIDRTAGAIS